MKHIHDHTSLPTCPYRWPNGQGDVAKFLEGDKNSDLWEGQFGGIYRLWAGTTPEVYVLICYSYPTFSQDLFVLIFISLAC